MTIDLKNPLSSSYSSVSPSSESRQSSDHEYNPWRVIPITTLLSIATIIGSGILALPVTLHHTSLRVFFVVFTVVYVANVAVIYAAVELFQRTTHHLHQLQLDQHEGSSSASPGDTTHILSPTNTQRITSKNITLFAIADLYLPSHILTWLFHICTSLTFLGLLMSYGLAGPQALWQILRPPPPPSFPPLIFFFLYCLTGVIAVIFFMNVLLPLFSTLTVLKGLLFIAVVLIVGVLPPSTRVASFRDLLYENSSLLSAVEPFLVAIVALGGLSNTMPVTYALLPEQPNRRQIAHFRGSVIAGLTTCYLLNIGWVIAIVQVVPRDGPSSLTAAYQKGQISTIPLVETLAASSGVSLYLIQAVTIIVQMFILVSAGVSFFIMAAGYKSYTAGVADGICRSLEGRRFGVSQTVARASAYTLTFGALIFFILFNPNGFITVLTRFASLTMSLQSGVFLFVMLYFCRVQLRSWPSGDGGDGSVALPMSRLVCSVVIVLGCLVCGGGSVMALFAPFLGIQTAAPRE